MGPVTTERAQTARKRGTRSSVPASPGPPAPAGGSAVQTRLTRIVVQDVRPSTPHGYPAKAVVGQPAPVTANIFKDGHDILAARAVLRRDGQVVDACALASTGNDEWSGAVAPREIGAHELVVEAWTDRYATWAHKAAIKLGAAQDLSAEVAEVILLVSGLVQDGKAPAAGREGAGPDNGGPDNGGPDNGRPDIGRPDIGRPDIGRPDIGRPDRGRPEASGPDGSGTAGSGPDGSGTAGSGPDGDSLAQALAVLLDVDADDASRVQAALSPLVALALAGDSLAIDTTVSAPLPIWVDRERAAVGAWYELFPRSFGGLRATAPQVQRVAEMGFDVLYLPPVHPIGHSFRKGKNNSLTPEAGDPGSPWATGSEEGGHTAVHPELGDWMTSRTWCRPSASMAWKWRSIMH